jgi:hypothetical protein
MSISEHFGYRNDSIQSDIHVFVSDIRITDADVGCQISPALRLMSMPTYAGNKSYRTDATEHEQKLKGKC